MKSSSQRKIALVTGASSGIGKATALTLNEKGYHVYGLARRVEKMRSLSAQGITTLPLDLTAPKSAEKVVKQILKEEGKIDILVNVAGIGILGSVEETPIAEGERQFAVNLFGLAKLIQLVTPSMRKAKAGKIINVSSMIGKFPLPLGAWYVASKHALEGFSDCLRMELTPFGIDVIIIEPGAIQTEFGGIARPGLLARSGEGPYEALIRKKPPKKEPSDPQVVADTILKALEAKAPETRYAIGRYADELLALRKRLSDREMDQVILEKFT